MNAEPPPTSYYALDFDRPSWFSWLEVFQSLFMLSVLVHGVERVRDNATSWFGWMSIGLGVVGFPLFAWSWWQRHRQERHFKLHDLGLVFLTESMRKPIHLPIESLSRIRWAAGNLHLETKDGGHHQLMTSCLPYDLIQEIKTDIREWGNRVGVEIVG